MPAIILRKSNEDEKYMDLAENFTSKNEQEVQEPVIKTHLREDEDE
jgi:hypothetical protein